MEPSTAALYVLLTFLTCTSMSLSSPSPSSASFPSHPAPPPASLPSLQRFGRSLFLAGGGDWDSQTDQHRRLVDMAGGAGVARLGLVVAASDKPEDKVRQYTPLFLAAGALAVDVIPVYATNMTSNSDPDVVRLIGRMTGFFFAGGEMWRVVQAFYTADRVVSPALAAIRQRHLDGAVVAGTSAGTACMTSAVMVVAGNSWEALSHGAKVTSDLPGDLIYDPDGGLGLFDGYVLDVHFGNRGREGRLTRLLADTNQLPRGTHFGLGLDEMTSLVVTWAGTDDVKGEVVGPGGMTLIDVTRTKVEDNNGVFAIHGVSVSYLTSGDVINLKSRQITFSKEKHPLHLWKRFEHAQSSDRIFYGKDADSSEKSEFYRVAASLYDSRLDKKATGSTEKSNPRFKVTMSRCAPGSAAFVQRMGSFSSDVYSYKNLTVDITST